MWNTWDAAPLDRVFDDVMRSMLGTATSARAYAPDIDVRSDDEKLIFECDVPGLRQDDIEVTVENRVLTIKGERKYDARENEQVVLGRRYGAFSRSFELPDYADVEKLSASMADGVLTIHVPKMETAKPRRVPIANGAGPKQLKS